MSRRPPDRFQGLKRFITVVLGFVFSWLFALLLAPMFDSVFSGMGDNFGYQSDPLVTLIAGVLGVPAGAIVGGTLIILGFRSAVLLTRFVFRWKDDFG